jgi:hypothetical protein
MANLYHPFDNDRLYALTTEGNIEISVDGKTGLFTTEGIHISGEIKQADPQLCNWVGNNPNPTTQLSRPRVAGREI